MMIQSSDDTSFSKINNLAQKSQLFKKSTNKQSWKLFKVKFRPNPDMQNSVYTKPFNLEL